MDCNYPSVRTNKARIVISYSHQGDGPKWKAALVKALQVFERHHLLDVWEDGKIRVSSFWDDDIKQAMSNARLAVVLLTKEALESQYILNTEFPFLRERQKRDKLPVFPVVCETCNWKDYDWLRATQAPNESNPLSQLSEAAQDRVFRKLATDIAEELSRATLAELPKPDQPLPTDHVYLDKFPLARGGGQPEKLISREQELALLDLAFAQPHTAVVSLVAWGGVGKTMLVQHWLQRLQREAWFGAQRVYAWSFYSQGTKEDRQASEDTFLAHSLEWFGVQCEPTLSPWDKGKILADAVARERTLLILDGIEPLQYPPGPMGGQLRAPGVQSLLKQLARKATSEQSAIPTPNSAFGSLCLVTTREPLTDLANFERRSDAAWGSMLCVDLGNLTEEAGAALLHHAGAKRAGAAEIKADDAELLAASREVDGHALTLNLLGRFLARAHGGDIRRRDLVKFEEADRKEQGGTTFKMLAALENWFARSGEFGARQLAVLRILGLFDRPADAGCIAALRKPPVIAGLTDPLFTTRLDANTGQPTVQPILEEDWNTATSFLADFSLLAIQTDTENYERWLDCHPLIREYFAKQPLGTVMESWRTAHRRLYEHLRDTTGRQPDTVEGLQPLYQAVGHGCQAGLFEDARANVYRDRILRGTTNDDSFYSWKKLGAYGDNLSALAHFYLMPWGHFVGGLSAQVRAWLSNETAMQLSSSGRLTEAIEANKGGLVIERERGDWKNATVRCINLSELNLILGNINAALDIGERSVHYAVSTNDDEFIAVGLCSYAQALFSAGRSSDVETCVRKATNHFKRKYAELESQRWFWFVQSKRRFEFLLSPAERFAWELTLDAVSASCDENSRVTFLNTCIEAEQSTAEGLAAWERESPLLTVALNQHVLGATTFYRAIIEKSAFVSAHEYLAKAIENLRRSAVQHYLVEGLLSRAWLRVLEGNADGARADLNEAWDVAERGPMRLHMADIHLYRARLFFREKPYPWKSPQDDLAAAEKLINDCGYHRRDEELADAKRAILGG